MLQRWSRLASLLVAFAFVVLLVVGILMATGGPSSSASGGKVIAYYHAHQTRFAVAVYLIGLSLVFGMFFFGGLRSYFRRDPAVESLAAVMFAGGVVFAISGALVSGFTWALVDVPTHLDAAAAQGLNVASSDVAGPAFLAGLAIFWLASGVAIERSRMLPRWLGWVAMVAGVVSLTPVGWVTAFVLAVWVIVVSILIYRPKAAPQQQPSAATG